MSWSGGYAEWTEGGTAFLSISFTWLLDKAYARDRGPVYDEQDGLFAEVVA